jgi:hypothetical protein
MTATIMIGRDSNFTIKVRQALTGQRPYIPTLGIMKIARVPFSAFVIVLAVAPGTSTAQGSTGYEKLPPVHDRSVMGEWDIGESCTGTIVSGGGKTYWAWMCVVNTGCCNGTHGYVLQVSGPNTYTDGHRKVTYTIQSDGNLRLTSPEGQDRIFGTQLETLRPSWKDFSWQRQ